MREWLSLKQLQFEVSTGVSMLEPAEKTAIYGILLIVLLMITYTTIMYLPGHLHHLVNMFDQT